MSQEAGLRTERQAIVLLAHSGIPVRKYLQREVSVLEMDPSMHKSPLLEKCLQNLVKIDCPKPSSNRLLQDLFLNTKIKMLLLKLNWDGHLLFSLEA